jgi:hypothetical protein|tara:strand:+ start:108 stop:686 length:579 start_codon:yes stop_codon:yes gene_type:complete
MSKKKKPIHYVSNKDFYVAMVNWKKEVERAVNDNKTPPPLTDYIGECIFKIATRLAYRPNFINYTYRDEMVSDGIENCIQYADRFNPDKSKNPFAYFTQIIYFAFLRRIEKEKKQSRVKDKMIKETIVNYSVLDGDESSYSVGLPPNLFTMNDNNPPSPKPPKKKKTKPKAKPDKRGLENFMNDETNEKEVV